MIAFLGMGLLGSNFVKALRKRGEEVRVWNRSPAKAKALEVVGAAAFDDVAEAVRGATRVHIVVSDDSAVDSVLESARPGLSKDAVIVDHTTTSPGGALERVQRWQERGIVYQHAPVFMGPANALDSTGIMLISGQRAQYEALEPALSKMTGKLVYLGEEPDRAAKFKLLGNGFLMFLTAGFADFFALAKAMGISSQDAGALFQNFNPGLTLTARLERVLRGNFSDPSWELGMARKDARLMLEAADQSGTTLAVLPMIAQLMDSYIARGHEHDDWTIITKDNL
jgi:3-hydroxyisobutyrate dehydrogenase